MTFVSYDLRTTDPEAAESFYTALMGWRVESQVLFAGERRIGELLALPERARALGAPAHWLGSIGVEDVDACAQRFIALGAQPLGPVQLRPDRHRVAPLRDPEGAVVAVSDRASEVGRDAVAWHELHTTDRDRAWSNYSQLFGWRAGAVLEIGPAPGGYQLFTDAAGRPVGGLANTARLPTVHTQWLFYFAVEDLDATLERFRSLGGSSILGPMELPGGDRIAHCEDLQGAAFGLRQRIR